jgi:hypothetical protein
MIWSLRLVGNLARFSGRMLVNVYDLLIFAPLWVEQLIKNSGDKTEESVEESAEAEVSSHFAR